MRVCPWVRDVVFPDYHGPDRTYALRVALPTSRISLANDLTYSGLIEALIAIISLQKCKMRTERD